MNLQQMTLIATWAFEGKMQKLSMLYVESNYSFESKFPG